MFSIQINTLQGKFRSQKISILAGIIPRNNKLFSLDEKEIFVDGKPIENWLKNDFNSEYSIDISDFQFQAEKGLFHIFGELFTSEINFIRNDQPDITSCALSLGKKAGQSTCPEHESFQNNYRCIGSCEIRSSLNVKKAQSTPNYSRNTDYLLFKKYRHLYNINSVL